MATANPFDLLGDDDNDDVSALVKSPPVVKEKQGARKTSNVPVQTLPSGKLLAKPLPPAQAVREVRVSQTEGGRGRGGSGRGGRGNRDQDFGRGRGGNINSEWGSDRESYDGYGGRGGFYESSISYAPGRQEDGEVASGERGRSGGGGRGGGRGGRGGRGHGGGRGFGGDAGEEEGVGKRMYDRRSGTGRGTEMKREGSGRGNWGTPVDREVLQEMEEPTSAEEEKLPTLENAEIETNQDIPPVNEEKKQEEEDKEMTLDEYERLLEEKRKKLLGGQKVEERKVDATAFESMKQLSIKKKDEDAVFIKVASEKDKEKKNDVGERDERIRKPISINEFLKPVEGERHYGVGRGRGRGRGNRGGGGFGGGDNALQSDAPSIEDHGQFPTLGGK